MWPGRLNFPRLILTAQDDLLVDLHVAVKTLVALADVLKSNIVQRHARSDTFVPVNFQKEVTVYCSKCSKLDAALIEMFEFSSECNTNSCGISSSSLELEVNIAPTVSNN